MTGALEAVILAGGFGTRLRGVIDDVPKSMAPVAGRPFLCHLLDALSHQGVGRVILAVHHMAEQIVVLGSRYKNLRLDYVREEAPLGTGGAMRQALNHVEGADALVLNGDTFLAVDYQVMIGQLRQTRSDLVLAARPVSDGSRYSLIQVDAGNNVTGFLPSGAAGQPGLIGAGVYAMRSNLFSHFHLPPTFSFEADVLARLTGNLRVQAHLVEGFFIDIGVPEDYCRAQIEIPAAVAAGGDRGKGCC